MPHCELSRQSFISGFNDFKNAFDSGNQQILLQTVQTLGLKGSALNLLKVYLSSKNGLLILVVCGVFSKTSFAVSQKARRYPHFYLSYLYMICSRKALTVISIIMLMIQHFSTVQHIFSNRA